MATLQIVLAIAATAAATAGSLDVASGPAAAGPEGPQYDEWKAEKTTAEHEAVAHAAKHEKMAAVDKVIGLMEHLKTQVLEEGTDEAHTYDKFACFCKDETTARKEAIEAGQEQQQGLEADIGEIAAFRSEVDAQIAELLSPIEDARKVIKKATATREAEKAAHGKNEDDFVSSIEAVDAAISMLQSSKAPTSLLQLRQIPSRVREALILADALGLTSATRATQAVASLLQQDPGVPMQDYGFHSDSIIETLEKLKEDFHASKAQLDEEEVMAQHEYGMLVEEKKDFIKTTAHLLEEAKVKRAKAMEHIQALSEQVSTVEAQLLADEEYMTALATMCHDNAVTWDQRTKMRTDELATLTSAIAVVKEKVTEMTTAATAGLLQRKADVSVAHVTASDEGFMDAIEARVETQYGSPDTFIQVSVAQRGLPAAFMQKRQEKPASAKDAVVGILRAEGNRIKSLLLLRLASQAESDPFKKVKKLIQELIERLLAQAAAETNQKGWCDKAISDAEQKRKYAVESIAELNAEIATIEAARDKLVEEMAVLGQEIHGLVAARASAKKLRAAEAAENAKTVEDAKAGIPAIEMAIDIISHFYQTAVKAGVTVAAAPAPAAAAPSLAQLEPAVHAHQGPLAGAPDPGFEAFRAYQGSQGSAKGILGMMEVIRSDFKRTLQVAEEEEAEAQQHFSELMLETGKSLAEKKSALVENKGYLLDAKDQLVPDREKLHLQSGILAKALTEIIELQKPCADTGMSYAQRVAMRQAEIEALKKAHCILDHMEEYNADGTGSSCE